MPGRARTVPAGMLEATAILVLTLVVFSAIVFVLTRVMKPRVDPAKEKARLERQIAWLEERQADAVQQRWDDEMKRRIEEQLADARTELAKLAA